MNDDRFSRDLAAKIVTWFVMGKVPRQWGSWSWKWLDRAANKLNNRQAVTVAILAARYLRGL